ncbi:MAG: biotin/lipoyl-binding protein [Clostridiales bacterium]|nr:biotin/lipoyl-binding protein [Clostridiales bacterium]
MKKYRVVVDGTEYEIGIEAMDSSELAPNAKIAAAPVNTAAQKSAPVQSGNQAKGEPIKSPMPGNILSVVVQNGSTVKKGQVLMILEAMKMENEIIAPRDGIVASVNVQSGMTVETGSVLCVLS